VSSSNLEYQIDVAIDSWDASAIGRLPVGQKMALYVRLGGASYSANIRTSIEDETEKDTRSGTDITYGFGFDYQAKKFGMRVAFDWLDIEDTGGVFLPTLGLTYTF